MYVVFFDNPASLATQVTTSPAPSSNNSDSIDPEGGEKEKASEELKKEQEMLIRLRMGEEIADGLVESIFRESATSVLDVAYKEASSAFMGLAGLGYWFDPALAKEVVHAIVGFDGIPRIEALTLGG